MAQYKSTHTGQEIDNGVSKALNPDATPTSGSDNLVKSGGVYDAIPSPSSATPNMDGTGAAGSSTDYSRADHVHPSDTSKADAEDVADIAEDVSELKSALKSGDEEDAIYHLGFYLDENGDLCQVEEETNNG